MSNPVSHSWLIVIAATVGVYYLAEWMAKYRRAHWPYHWIRLFRRHEHVVSCSGAEGVLQKLLSDDPDVRAVGLTVKRIAQGTYMLSIPLLPHMRWHSEGTASLVTGHLYVDKPRSTVVFTVGLAPGHSVATLLWPLALALMAISARKPGSAFFFLILCYALGWGAFRLSIKPRLEDFWFLVTSELDKPDSGRLPDN